MSRSLLNEELVGLTAVAKRFPGRNPGRPLNKTSVFRWATKGCRAADGSVAVLESVRIGSRLLTTWSAVNRFFDRLNATPPPPKKTRTPSERNAAFKRADRALRKKRA